MQIPKEENPTQMNPAVPPDNLQEAVEGRYDQAIQTLMKTYPQRPVILSRLSQLRKRWSR